MLHKILITEEEKNEISNSYDDIDRKLMTFLLRRVEKKERKIGIDDEYPINVIEITFSDLPGHGFNSFASKKEMEKKIIDMLYENDIIDYWLYDLDQQDPKRVKTIKTVRTFLNFIMPKK